MSIRILTSGRTFVQELEVPIIDSIFLPLLRDQVDIGSIRANKSLSLIISPEARVAKDTKIYEGRMVEHTDRIVTLDSGAYRMSIKNWDQIQEPRLLELASPIAGPLIMSFITNGIGGQIVHRLYLGPKTSDGGTLETSLVVQNRTPMNLTGVKIEVMTAEEVRMFRAQALEMASSNASPSQGESGTIYTLQGAYNILANIEARIPMMEENVSDIESLYVIDAPNGQANALQIIRFSPTMDLPSGTLYIYRNGRLEASSFIEATGQGQERQIPILRIPSISAMGEILIDTMDAEDARTGINKDTITLNGTIKNSLSMPITAYIRYQVGIAKIVSRGISNGSPYQRQGPYILFPYSVGPKGEVSYSRTFTIQH